MIYVFCRGLLRLIYAIVFPLKIVGEENVPKEGGVLLCANHISLLDPMTIGIKLDRQVKYMAKAELLRFLCLAGSLTNWVLFRSNVVV